MRADPAGLVGLFRSALTSRIRAFDRAFSGSLTDWGLKTFQPNPQISEIRAGDRVAV